MKQYYSSLSVPTSFGASIDLDLGWISRCYRRPRCGNTSSATAAGGETSRKHYGRRWKRRQAGKRADADTCRSPRHCPQTSATKRLWTSWQPPKSGSSRPNETKWQYGSGAELRCGGGGNNGVIPLFLPFFLCFFVFIFHVLAGTKGSGGGSSAN